MDRYRTFGSRVWAGIIDGLVFVPVGLANIYLAAPERGPTIILLWGVVSYSAYWLYSVLMHARYGQNLGKMVARVKVLDLSEDHVPSLRQAFLRDIGYIIPNCISVIYLFVLVASQQYSLNGEMGGTLGTILFWTGQAWFLIEIVTMATNEKRRALHDWIAGTVVVHDDEQGVVASIG